MGRVTFLLIFGNDNNVNNDDNNNNIDNYSIYKI